MFVYTRHSASPEIRPHWVIGTRLVTVGVTVTMAWPWLEQFAALRMAVIVYAAISAAVILFVVLARYWKLRLLAGTVLAAQIASELIVISTTVYLSGGVESPSVSLYLMTIVSAALSYRLVGTLLVSSLSSAAFLTAVWIHGGHPVTTLWSPDWFGVLGQLPDQDFFVIFMRLCVFFLCAFTGGYLAERLYSKDAALAHTSEALKIAKLETGDILKHLRSGVLTIDAGGHVVFFNRAAEDILGMEESRLRGRLLSDSIGRQYPVLAERLDAVLQSQVMDIRTELTLERPDGRVIPIGISTSILGGSGARPRGVIAVFQDLTDAKALEDKVRSNDRLAAIGELSAGIAHEIRNPLAAISGSVEVLRNELALEGENQRLMGLITRESERLNTMLSDFLLYARMRPVVTEPVAIAQVLEEVLQIGRQHTQRSADLMIRSQSDLPDLSLRVLGDSDHLKQVLINLVLNAIEACTEGAPGAHAVTLKVHIPDAAEVASLATRPAGDPGEWVAISVSDDGCGIPESIQDRLYEPFVSSKSTGTGLGLAVAKRLMDSVGGHIVSESRPGRGTTFTIYLKRCPAGQVSVGSPPRQALRAVGRTTEPANLARQ